MGDSGPDRAVKVLKNGEAAMVKLWILLPGLSPGGDAGYTVKKAVPLVAGRLNILSGQKY
jgi:hypothetical protein